MRESDLYAPVKHYLEGAGYTVRGEVGKCDVVAVLGESMVAVELKLSFGLPVLYQALQRLPAFDLVYVAVAVPEGRIARENFDSALRDAVRMCRMLGLGFLTVRDGLTEVQCDPGVYVPRKSPPRRARLLSEFRRRSGDHNLAGTTRRPRITAYREDSLRLVRAMRDMAGHVSPAHARDAAGVQKAAAILRGNVYGWFKRIGRGAYSVSPQGIAALDVYADVVRTQMEAAAD